MNEINDNNESNFPTFRNTPRNISRGIRWLWRKTWKFSVALLILLIIAHMIINFIAGRRLEAELKKIRDAGAPLTLTEAASPKVPDAENAATYIRKLSRKWGNHISHHRE